MSPADVDRSSRWGNDGAGGLAAVEGRWDALTASVARSRKMDSKRTLLHCRPHATGSWRARREFLEALTNDGS